MLYVTSRTEFFNLILNIEIVLKVGLQNFGAMLMYMTFLKITILGFSVFSFRCWRLPFYEL